MASKVPVRLLPVGSSQASPGAMKEGKKPHPPPHLVQEGCHNKAAGALISESRSLPYAHVQRTGSVQAGGETSDSLGKDLEAPEA